VAHLFSRRLVVSLAALSLLSGCGGDDSPEKGLTSEGKSQTDRESAKEIVTYFERNKRSARRCGRALRLSGTNRVS